MDIKEEGNDSQEQGDEVFCQPASQGLDQLVDALKLSTAAQMAEVFRADKRLLTELLGP